MIRIMVGGKPMDFDTDALTDITSDRCLFVWKTAAYYTATLLTVVPSLERERASHKARLYDALKTQNEKMSEAAADKAIGGDETYLRMTENYRVAEGLLDFLQRTIMPMARALYDRSGVAINSQPPEESSRNNPGLPQHREMTVSVVAAPPAPPKPAIPTPVSTPPSAPPPPTVKREGMLPPPPPPPMVKISKK